MVVKLRDSSARGPRRAWSASRGGSSLWTRRLRLVAVLGGLLSSVDFVLQGRGSRVTDSRPRGQQQQQTSICKGPDSVALSRYELHHQPRRTGDALARHGREFHLAAENRDPRSLVDLMVLHGLTRGNRQRDRARIVRRGEDLRSVED
jgi:hypothetical protein